MEKTIKVLKQLHEHLEGRARVEPYDLNSLSYVSINNNWYCLHYGSLVEGGIIREDGIKVPFGEREK